MDSALTRDFLRVIHFLMRRDFYAAANSYESLLLRAGSHNSIGEMRAAVVAYRGIGVADMISYRVALFHDLTQITSRIPAATELKISDCGVCCETTLDLINSSQRSTIRNDCDSFASSAKINQDRQLSALFIEREARHWLRHPDCPDVQLLFSTAHGVKGETYDGVVLCAKKRTLGCGCPRSAATWQSILTHSMVDCETKRIAYVALSRAAQMLRHSPRR